MIKMVTDGPLELHRCDLQIKDRYIAALIRSPWSGEIFTIWDWKSGECVLVSSLPYILFIAPTTYLPRTQFRH
jgi:hypothetical protein